MRVSVYIIYRGLVWDCWAERWQIKAVCAYSIQFNFIYIASVTIWKLYFSRTRSQGSYRGTLLLVADGVKVRGGGQVKRVEEQTPMSGIHAKKRQKTIAGECAATG